MAVAKAKVGRDGGRIDTAYDFIFMKVLGKMVLGEWNTPSL